MNELLTDEECESYARALDKLMKEIKDRCGGSPTEYYLAAQILAAHVRRTEMKLMKCDYSELETRVMTDLFRRRRRRMLRIGIMLVVGSLFGLLAILVLALSGCSTLIHGPTQEVLITSEPPGAVVTPTDYKRFAYTPGAIVLDRNQGTVLTARLYGYEDCEVEIDWGLSPWAFGNMGALAYPWLVAGCQPVAAAWGLDADSIGQLSPGRVHFEMVKK